MMVLRPRLRAWSRTGAAVLFLSAAPRAWCAENGGAPPRIFAWIDWLVVVAYGAASLGIGFHFARKQRTTEEYFTAGRNARPFLAGISLFAALFTVISYIANPGEYIQNGPVVAITHAVQFPFTYMAVGWLMIPVIMRLPITSAYELLEKRLGRPVRLLGSMVFILTRLVWMSLILFTVSRVLIYTLGWDPRYGPSLEIVTGLVTITYTLVGGIDAVMVTDVMQLFVLLAGALFTIGSISVRLGGISEWWPRHWQAHWAPQPLISFDPHVRVTVASGLISSLLWAVCVAGSDQIVVQRYLTTRDAATARRAYLLNAISSSVVAAILGLVGAALLRFYQMHPGGLPRGITFAKNGDALFPHYISHYLPVGISGLVVSGLLAAAMSGLSSGINSITTVVSKDFIEVFHPQKFRAKPTASLSAPFSASFSWRCSCPSPPPSARSWV
jgi:SSS family solute:Na+ symporter